MTKTIGTTDDKIRDVRRVTLYFLQGSPQAHVVHKDMVDRFVEASRRLHHTPGVNPHNNAKTSHIWKITVAELEWRGPYWWTTPNLHQSDAAGAPLLEGGVERTVWCDQEVIDRFHAEEDALEEAMER